MSFRPAHPSSSRSPSSSIGTHRHRSRVAALLVVSAFLLTGLGPLIAFGGAATVGEAPVGASSSAPRMFDHPADPAIHAIPSAGYVNPFALISREPAPMGIADFGVTAAAGTVHAYSYTSKVFQGNVEIDSMLTNGGGQSYMTFQLNTVVVYTLGGINYSYWIQNIASIQSSVKGIGWIDNIWNLTSPAGGGPIAVGEISGNGTVNNQGGSNWYADSPGAGFAGSGVTLTYPTNVSIRSVDSTIGGTPEIGFQYNDGFGWVTYDNVTFHHMHDAVNDGFLVDGFQYTPLGIFYDAEWDYAGSGQGQHNIYSELNMSLEFWNGHNYQAIPNAFNFGSDTAESLDNVIAALGTPLANGSLYSHVYNGSGQLGVLYNTSEVANLDVSTPSVAIGTLDVNGTPIAFRGGAANLTVTPGTYNVSLVQAGVVLDSESVTLAAGSLTHLVLPSARFLVQFEENGLPMGTNWSVTFNGATVADQYVFLNATVKNGSYDYQVQPVPGFVSDVRGGTVPVAGAPVVIVINFQSFNYTATFVEFGLPESTAWSVTVSGHTLTGTGSSLVFSLANGTYDYEVSTVNTFNTSQSNGSVVVQAQATETDFQFVLRLGSLVGTVSPSNATVLLDGVALAVSDGAFALIGELPGVHSFEAELTGYTPEFRNITVTPGNTSSVNFTLEAVPGGGGSGSNPGSGGGQLPASTLVIAAVVVGAIVVVALALAMRRRKA